MSDLGDVAAIAGAVGTAAVSVAGLYLAHNYRRQTRVQLADARRSAYATLWQATGLAAPSRLDTAGVNGSLTKHERQRLFQLLTDWYYRDGNGMLLDEPTRSVYLKAKANLVCHEDAISPKHLLGLFPDEMSIDDRRGCMSIRQLSLLRSQMKADLAIFGHPYVGQLSEHEFRFLEACNVDINRPPWVTATRHPVRVERCRPPDLDASTGEAQAGSFPS